MFFISNHRLQESITTVKNFREKEAKLIAKGMKVYLSDEEKAVILKAKYI